MIISETVSAILELVDRYAGARVADVIESTKATAEHRHNAYQELARQLKEALEGTQLVVSTIGVQEALEILINALGTHSMQASGDIIAKQLAAQYAQGFVDGHTNAKR